MTITSKEQTNAVEMRDIVLRFPGVLANDHVNFTLRRGEIHALLGENGAGKSTLMNILAGIYKPESGTILVNGDRAVFNSPKDAINRGIGMVHQHFMLVPTQTVTENILLGLNDPGFIMHLPRYDQKVADLAEKYGLKVQPTAKIWQLSVGEQQRVEILKTLYRGAEILILDEPTAVLAPQEIQELMETMRLMVQQGKSIVFISHKLNEVKRVADRLTVLRKGKVTADGIGLENITKETLAELMVGRKVLFQLNKNPHTPGDIVLDVQNVSALNNRGLPALKNVSFQLRKGEILGIAGIAGNGQSELAEVITGLRACQGNILVNCKQVANQSPKRAIEQGTAHIPEDRTGVGTAPGMALTGNMIMKSYDHAPISQKWRISYTAAREFASNLKEKYNIQAPSLSTQVNKLSGGNLQKVILAREISCGPTLIVAVQPTRGLDVGAIEGIQNLLLEQREKDAAVLLISEELDELLDLSDRIAVIFEGELAGIFPTEEADVKTIGLLMTGELRRQE
ncbi:MAG TPA: ABC transporter ATP-binding protein [Anaerolineaceae bacterium]|nr:ABC transporter ATP-binding protein [Anaerolineaceae bacterium]